MNYTFATKIAPLWGVTKAPRLLNLGHLQGCLAGLHQGLQDCVLCCSVSVQQGWLLGRDSCPRWTSPKWSLCLLGGSCHSTSYVSAP